MNTGRQKYYNGDQLLYEWEQGLDEVNIYFYPPKWALNKYLKENQDQFGPSYKTPKLLVNITNKNLSVGIEGHPPFINVSL